MLMFRPEDRARVARGEITVSFRLWKYPHVKAGKTYSTGFGTVAIDDVQQVPATLIPPEDLGPAGCETLEELWHSAEHGNTHVDPESMLYRVQLRFLEEAPPSLPRVPASKRSSSDTDVK